MPPVSTPLVLGWEEWVALPELRLPAIKAKVDTGARTSALHAYFVEPFTLRRKPMVRFGVHPIPRRNDVSVLCTARVVDRRVEEMEAALRDAPTTLDGIQRMIPGAGDRREADDGWLAVFFEFWAHVLRHPELRERFARQHRRVIEPLAKASEGLVGERARRQPGETYKLATARFAMQLGLQLERLTQPDVVDADLGRRMG